MARPKEWGLSPLPNPTPPPIEVIHVNTPNRARAADALTAVGYKDRFSRHVPIVTVKEILCRDQYSDPSRSHRLLAYVSEGRVQEHRPDGTARFAFGKEEDAYPIEAAELVEPVDGWEPLHGDLSPGQTMEIGRISIPRRQSRSGNTVPILRRLLETGMSLPQISERGIERAYVIMKPGLAVRFEEAGFVPVGPFEVRRPERPTEYAQRTYDTFSYWDQLPGLYYLPISPVEVYKRP